MAMPSCNRSDSAMARRRSRHETCFSFLPAPENNCYHRNGNVPLRQGSPYHRNQSSCTD